MAGLISLDPEDTLAAARQMIECGAPHDAEPAHYGLEFSHCGRAQHGRTSDALLASFGRQKVAILADMPVGAALRDAYICDRDLRLCCCGEPANAEATTSRGDNVAQSSSRGSGK